MIQSSDRTTPRPLTPAYCGSTASHAATSSQTKTTCCLLCCVFSASIARLPKCVNARQTPSTKFSASTDLAPRQPTRTASTRADPRQPS